MGFLGLDREEGLDFGLLAYYTTQLLHIQVTSTLKIETECSSQMLVATCQNTRHLKQSTRGAKKTDTPVRLNGASTDG
jgi:hypothetical protein